MSYFRRKSDFEIRMLADHIRRKTGVFDSFPVSVTLILENAKNLLPKLVTYTTPDIKLKLDKATVDGDTQTVYFRRSLIDKLHEGDAEARWTCSHELNHLFAGHRGKLAFADGRDIRAQNDPIKFAQEEEAEQLTMEVLAPRNLVEHCDTVDELAERAGIPHDKATERFTEIAKIKLRENGIKPVYSMKTIEQFELFEMSGAKLATIDVQAEKLRTLERIAVEHGFETEQCPECGNFTIQKSGPLKLCASCGWPDCSDGAIW